MMPIWKKKRLLKPQAMDDELVDLSRTNTNFLEGWKLVGVVIALNAANGVAFVDLLGVTSILPAISDFFTSGSSIAWASTCQLIGSTVGLAVLGYISETWSRRLMLLISLGFLAISATGCALSHYQTSTDLFCVLRTFSGIATGSISNLVNIAQNDFLPERKRLKYQGVQGLSVASGSIFGMMVGASFAKETKWHNFYYIVLGLAACAWLGVFLCVPANCTLPKREQINDALCTIDYFGIISGIGFIVPGLLLMSQFSILGKTVNIVLGAVTALSGTIFLILGFLKDRGTVRPIVPFRLFRNRTIATILVQNILFGATYYSFSFYLPLNLQIVRDMRPIVASAYQVPYYVVHGMWSTASALIILNLQKKGKRSYSIIFLFGFATWTIAMIVLAVDSEYRVPGLVIVLGCLVGIGTGSSFQNSVLAISAQADKETKGLAVGIRNVLRSFGGALGTAVSSAILRNRLEAKLPLDLNDWHLAESAFSHAPLQRLTPSQRAAVSEAYDGAIAWVFYVSAILVGVCFLLCPLIRDQVKKNIEDEEEGVKLADRGRLDVGGRDGSDEEDDKDDGYEESRKSIDSDHVYVGMAQQRRRPERFEQAFNRPVSFPLEFEP